VALYFLREGYLATEHQGWCQPQLECLSWVKDRAIVVKLHLENGGGCDGTAQRRTGDAPEAVDYYLTKRLSRRKREELRNNIVR
jgi:hypothetical protein